ncbi:MAG: aldo/keto reductase [Propionivibrio sp.]|uniref:aldo/keto reductase n=1 Tax=Propionivibrio sp. TaxID=2212460 RepID=UPI0025CD740E|nr:aldo/keto reductase [Propionivibrio sp.]MBK7354702.1 aldo/keto reductase [Propionivibrio sp.]MBK8402073.1 aldo/keto reductase [Propionivibrio sp.]
MKLALGTVQFGLKYGIANQSGQVMRTEAKAMLQLAADIGIDTIDTAIAYGESEACLGEAGIQGFKLVTKAPPAPDGIADAGRWIRDQMAASLDRLGVNSIYGLLLHQSDQLLGLHGKDIYHSLQCLKESGQVKKIGVSVYSPRELEVIPKLFCLDLVQAPFSLVDRRLQSTGWLQRLKDAGVEIHTRSAFLQGLLLMSRADTPTKFSPWNALWDRWNQWLSGHEISALQACLAFPLSFPQIDRVVVGADSVRQLAQIFRAASNAPQSCWPDLQCEDENLINPSRWHLL